MVDAAALKESWSTVVAYGDQVPLFFYSTLFLNHPELRDLFPASMAAQRDKLVAALGATVSQVESLPTLVPMLEQLGRDHRKFEVRNEHYPAVGDALLATLAYFLGNHWTPELAAEWSAAYRLVATVMIDASHADTSNPPWWDAEVIAYERRTLDVAVLTVRTQPYYDYRAGQSVMVECPARPRIWRPYSPANSPRDDSTIEFHVKLAAGGQVSAALIYETHTGDVLRLGAPIGTRLTLTNTVNRDLLLLAGGTGLAPLKALIEQVALEGGNRQVTLFMGARTGRELYDLRAMERLVHQYDWLHMVPTVTHDDGHPVDVALKLGRWTARDVYICGSDQMVADSVAKLLESGTPHEALHYEGVIHEHQ